MVVLLYHRLVLLHTLPVPSYPSPAVSIVFQSSSNLFPLYTVSSAPLRLQAFVQSSYLSTSAASMSYSWIDVSTHAQPKLDFNFFNCD